MNKVFCSFIIGIASTLLITSTNAQITEFKLEQNEPNPFDQRGTQIRYQIATQCLVQLWVEDTNHSLVKTLVSVQLSAGFHSVRWNARDESCKIISMGEHVAKMLCTVNNDTLFSDSITLQFQPMVSSEPETKLIACAGKSNEFFGERVAINGDRAIVGAKLNNDKGHLAGAAYIFEWDGITWNESAMFTASDASNEASFGSAVAIDGDRAIVGAVRDGGKGAAYIFEWDGTTWTETVKLTASDGEVDDRYGYSVSISGDRAVIGSIFDDDDTIGFDTGSAYIYEWDGTTWTEVVNLMPADAAESDFFGGSVSIDGDRVIIGADFDEEKGSATIFEWDGASWLEKAKLVDNEGAIEDRFGHSVSISGDRAIVGSPFSAGKGSAFIFELDGTDWVEAAKLTASDGEVEDRFGESVAIDGTRAVVGARLHDSDNGFDSGAACVFEWDGKNWKETTKLIASDGVNQDEFGSSVSVSGDRVLVGERRDDDNGFDAGAAYIYDLTLVTSVAVDQTGDIILPTFDLQQNFPNPFNPTTTIRYTIPEAGLVQIKIYNELGQLVRSLVNEQSPAGESAVVWDRRNDKNSVVPSGIYFYTLKIRNIPLISKRMLLIK